MPKILCAKKPAATYFRVVTNVRRDVENNTLRNVLNLFQGDVQSNMKEGLSAISQMNSTHDAAKLLVESFLSVVICAKELVENVVKVDFINHVKRNVIEH